MSPKKAVKLRLLLLALLTLPTSACAPKTTTRIYHERIYTQEVVKAEAYYFYANAVLAAQEKHWLNEASFLRHAISYDEDSMFLKLSLASSLCEHTTSMEEASAVNNWLNDISDDSGRLSPSDYVDEELIVFHRASYFCARQLSDNASRDIQRKALRGRIYPAQISADLLEAFAQDDRRSGGTAAALQSKNGQQETALASSQRHTTPHAEVNDYSQLKLAAAFRSLQLDEFAELRIQCRATHPFFESEEMGEASATKSTEPGQLQPNPITLCDQYLLDANIHATSPASWLKTDPKASVQTATIIPALDSASSEAIARLSEAHLEYERLTPQKATIKEADSTNQTESE